MCPWLLPSVSWSSILKSRCLVLHAQPLRLFWTQKRSVAFPKDERVLWRLVLGFNRDTSSGLDEWWVKFLAVLHRWMSRKWILWKTSITSEFNQDICVWQWRSDRKLRIIKVISFIITVNHARWTELMVLYIRFVLFTTGWREDCCLDWQRHWLWALLLRLRKSTVEFGVTAVEGI